MIEERKVIDRVEYLPKTGHIQVREVVELVKDGEVMATLEPIYHRYVIEPNVDLSLYPQEIQDAKAVAEQSIKLTEDKIDSAN